MKKSESIRNGCRVAVKSNDRRFGEFVGTNTMDNGFGVDAGVLIGEGRMAVP